MCKTSAHRGRHGGREYRVYRYRNSRPDHYHRAGYPDASPLTRAGGEILGYCHRIKQPVIPSLQPRNAFRVIAQHLRDLRSHRPPPPRFMSVTPRLPAAGGRRLETQTRETKSGPSTGSPGRRGHFLCAAFFVRPFPRRAAALVVAALCRSRTVRCGAAPAGIAGHLAHRGTRGPPDTCVEPRPLSSRRAQTTQQPTPRGTPELLFRGHNSSRCRDVPPDCPGTGQ